MTTLNPRPPYTPEEIQRLYPPGLRLKTVMVVSPGVSGAKIEYGTQRCIDIGVN